MRSVISLHKMQCGSLARWPPLSPSINHLKRSIKIPDSRIANRRLAMAKAGGEAYKARRKLIIETAAQVFKDKGYEAASLNDIALVLGTDRASLYYYAAS